MDDLDARAESLEIGGFDMSVPSRPELRIVPSLEDEETLRAERIERVEILKSVFEKIDFGAVLTQEARNFLERAITQVFGKIPADMKREAFEVKIRELAIFAFQVFSSAGILGIPAEKRIPDSVRRMILDNFLLGETLDRHEGRWPNTHGRARLLTVAKEISRTKERVGQAAGLSEELAQMDGSESQSALRTKLQAGARMFEWLDRARNFQGDVTRAETKFAEATKNDRTDVDRMVDKPESALAFFAPLFERQLEEPVDGDFIAQTLQERDWRTLKYPDPAVHPLLAVHEIVRRAGREKFGRDKQHVLCQDLLRMVFDEGRPLLRLLERIEERQLPFGPFHEPRIFHVPAERRFVPWSSA